jgi:indole-3-glycerol phosphate synthase
LAARKEEDVLLVAESGIQRRVDVERLAFAGAHAVLVGESLMRGDIPSKIAELLD